jgi:pyruvoyl-dependent arginine decarboxylase (PvlArgDC)
VIGRGKSDVGIETRSYDAVLQMAGIENCNVLLYTSVLPPETVELPHLSQSRTKLPDHLASCWMDEPEGL